MPAREILLGSPLLSTQLLSARRGPAPSSCCPFHCGNLVRDSPRQSPQQAAILAHSLAMGNSSRMSACDLRSEQTMGGCWSSRFQQKRCALCARARSVHWASLASTLPAS